MSHVSRWTREQFRKQFAAAFPDSAPPKQKHLEMFFDMNKDYLPAYLPDKLLAVPLVRYFNNDTLQETLWVPIEQIHGEGWLFERDFGGVDRFGYLFPKPEKLSHWFLKGTPEELEPIEAIRIDETKYAVIDGNHRLYSTYLRGWNLVKLKLLGEASNSRSKTFGQGDLLVM